MHACVYYSGSTACTGMTWQNRKSPDIANGELIEQWT